MCSPLHFSVPPRRRVAPPSVELDSGIGTLADGEWAQEVGHNGTLADRGGAAASGAGPRLRRRGPASLVVGWGAAAFRGRGPVAAQRVGGRRQAVDETWTKR